jgi:hypothetical protein
MKKLMMAMVTLASLAFNQPAQAAVSNINESFHEYQTIISADFAIETVIPQNEFIVDIRRLTRDIEITVPTDVYYRITTKIPEGIEGIITTIETEINGESAHSHSHSHSHSHRRHRDPYNRYIVHLLVTPNPGIGPNIVTFISIQPETHDFFDIQTNN